MAVYFFTYSKKRNLLLDDIHGQHKVGAYARKRYPEKLPVDDEQCNNNSQPDKKIDPVFEC